MGRAARRQSSERDTAGDPGKIVPVAGPPGRAANHGGPIFLAQAQSLTSSRASCPTPAPRRQPERDSTGVASQMESTALQNPRRSNSVTSISHPRLAVEYNSNKVVENDRLARSIHALAQRIWQIGNVVVLIGKLETLRPR